jgi:hypothetical protein
MFSCWEILEEEKTYQNDLYQSSIHWYKRIAKKILNKKHNTCSYDDYMKNINKPYISSPLKKSITITPKKEIINIANKGNIAKEGNIIKEIEIKKETEIKKKKKVINNDINAWTIL